MEYNSSSDDEWDSFLLESPIFKSRKRYWVHKLWQQRDDSGEFQNVCTVLNNYPSKFYNYFRMDISTFEYILNAIKNDLTKYSNFRRCIEPKEKLAVTLR